MNQAESSFIEVYIPMNDVYPEWWNVTVTLYNKYESSSGEITWYRTVLEGCFWKYETDYTRVDNATQMTKVLLCRVRKSDSFLENFEWRELDSKGDYFTFSEGDILIRGEVEDIVDEYTAGSRSSDLLKKYKDRCAEITECRINVDGGRVCEHYLVRGI